MNHLDINAFKTLLFQQHFLNRMGCFEINNLAFLTFFNQDTFEIIAVSGKKFDWSELMRQSNTTDSLSIFLKDLKLTLFDASFEERLHSVGEKMATIFYC